MSKILMVENEIDKVVQKCNVINVSTWTGSYTDNELSKLAQIIRQKFEDNNNYTIIPEDMRKWAADLNKLIEKTPSNKSSFNGKP